MRQDLRVTQLVNKGQQSMTLDDNPDLTWPEKPPVMVWLDYETNDNLSTICRQIVYNLS